MAGTPARPADVINLVIQRDRRRARGGVRRRGVDHRRCARPSRGRADGPGRGRGSRLHARSRIAAVIERPAAGSRVPEADQYLRPAPSRPHLAPGADCIEGRPVWAASATHDIGIKFARAERTFTHRVEADIDLERQKIVDDLRFAGVRRALRARAPGGDSGAVDQRHRRRDDDRRPGRGPRPPPPIKRQGPGAAPSVRMKQRPGPCCSCRARQRARQLITSCGSA